SRRLLPAPERGGHSSPPLVRGRCPAPELASRRPVPADGAPAFGFALHPPPTGLPTHFATDQPIDLLADQSIRLPTGQRIRRAPENSLPVSHFFQSVT